MLYKWAMEQNKLVKKLAMLCFQRELLHLADAIHITEPGEQDALDHLEINTKSTLVPNGIDIEEFTSMKEREKAKVELGLDPSINYVLFMSRIHPKKGLIHLINAWSSLSKKHGDWNLLIVGPVDDKGYLSEIKSILETHNLTDRVVMTGMLNGSERLDAFAASSLFVLPSYTENFGIVICEALAAGLPVITTIGTPWKVIKDNSIGWWVRPNDEDIKKSLSEAFNLSPEDLKLRGQRGLDVAKNFKWSNQSRNLYQLYCELCQTD
jgi:glycosyltransferase involved in cell wall biosynthesis